MVLFFTLISKSIGNICWICDVCMLVVNLPATTKKKNLAFEGFEIISVVFSDSFN